MLARHYRSDDAPALNQLLGQRQVGDIRLDRDRLIVLGRPAGGLLVWRPGGIVHELHTGNGLGQRHRADAMVGFAIADSVSRPFHLWEAVFVTDSDRMAEYAINHLKATEEVGKRVFTLAVR